MFGFLLGWRKASKCKKLIKQVQCRLKLLRNKKGAITKQLREDVVQLIMNGNDQTAFNRVEQIVKDEGRMAAYEILGNFCEFILLNFSYIRKHKDCPNDVNEAVSSLMFASARCGDLPELQLIRKLFGERYGRRFESTAVELTPGNLVNRQIKEKLLTNSVSDDDKQRMINEIARDCLQTELLALEYRSDWHQNQMVIPRGAQVHDDGNPKQHKKQAANADETKREDLRANSATSTSCESLPQFPEERIVYLDDVVELCSSTATEGDQRLFKFKTASTLPKKEIGKHDISQTDLDQSELWSDIENSSSKTSVKGTKKGFVAGGKPKKEDIECVSHNGQKQRFVYQIQGDNFSKNVPNRLKGNEKDNHEISPWKQRKRENWASDEATDEEMECASFYKKPRRRRKKREPPPSSDLRSTAYDVFIYNGYNSNIDNKKVAGKETKSSTVEDCYKMDLSSSVKNKREALYLRAETLPPERPKESQKVSFPRTNSCPYKQPTHVHPKLPDYDDIAAQFMALKREHLKINTLKP